MHQLHFRIDDEIYKGLRDFAEKRNLSLQEATRIAMRFFLSNVDKTDTDEAEFSFADLYAGIGGTRLGFEQAGCVCKFSSEWDKFCQKTYFANFGEQCSGDLSKIPAEEIPDHDILTASFPLEGEMSDLTDFDTSIKRSFFYDTYRILEEKRPKAFLFEGVKNLPTHNKGKTFKLIKKALVTLNYSYEVIVLNSRYFVPQNRERIYIIGYDKNRYTSIPDLDLNLSKEKEPVLEDILEDRVDKKYTISDRLFEYSKIKNKLSQSILEKNDITGPLTPRYHKDGLDILIAQDKQNPRRLTPRECARLQGFPDSFKIPVSDTQAYKQFGNSVTVPLIRVLAEKITETLKHLDAERKREIEYYI